MLIEEETIAVPQRRLRFEKVARRGLTQSFAEGVREGLSASPRQLSCSWFYDRRGSELFERICDLPEYYLTRTEHNILRERAGAIAEMLPEGSSVVELGSGSSVKTRPLLRALLERGPSLHYCPIDISTEILAEASESLVKEMPALWVSAIEADYLDGVARSFAALAAPRLVLFLGSTIGNFQPAEARCFLRAIRRHMCPTDTFLLGADLKKEPGVLEAAYNDSAGVTAQFNKNVLIRINRELCGEFDLQQFDHYAPYLPERSRIEMRLVSRRKQEVRIDALGCSFAFGEGESILTECCHKYSEQDLGLLAAGAEFRLRRRWTDPRRLFSLSLLEPIF